MLNGIRDKLLCVRGNCDTEVDRWFWISRFWQTMPF